MNQFRLCVFDLDGTLMDTSSGIIQATDYVVNEFKLPLLTDAEKSGFIGPPIQKSFQTRYNCSTERAWELATAWRDAYKDRFLLDAKPYDGIYELLRFCREQGIKTGVATNKREDYTSKLLENFSFSPLFDYVVGSDFEGERTKVDMIQLCMEQTGMTEPSVCLMIGDTEGDRTAAQEAGVQFLGVTYGFGFRRGVPVPGTDIVDSCAEIGDYLLNSAKNAI